VSGAVTAHRLVFVLTLLVDGFDFCNINNVKERVIIVSYNRKKIKVIMLHRIQSILMYQFTRINKPPLTVVWSWMSLPNQ